MKFLALLLCIFAALPAWSADDEDCRPPVFPTLPGGLDLPPQIHISNCWPYISVNGGQEIDNFLNEIAGYNPLELLEVLENLPGETTMRGTVNFGYIHGNAYFAKKEIQRVFDENDLRRPFQIDDPVNKAICISPSEYTNQELRLGKVVGTKKYIMLGDIDDPTQEFPNTVRCEHALNMDLAKNLAKSDPSILQHLDKVRQFEFPLELGRDYPTFNVDGFDLLNADIPGHSKRSFELTKQTFGDTLVKIVPDGNRLYIHACEMLPGHSLQNKGFTLEYVYLKLLNLSLLLNGKLGGVEFSALRFCTLTRIEHDPTYLPEDPEAGNSIIATLDVDFPTAFNMHRVPLEIHVAAVSWLILVLLILILAAFAALLPGVLGVVIPIIFAVLALVVTVVGLLSSSILTNFANQWVDQQIKNNVGINLDDLNKEGKEWAKPIVDKIIKKEGIFKGTDFFSVEAEKKRQKEGDIKGFENGKWALDILTKDLLENQLILAQATVEASYETFVTDYVVAKGDILQRCRDTASGIERIRSEFFQEIFDEVHREIVNVCDSIQATDFRIRPFMPRPSSQAAGCYDNFIRLEDVELGNIKLLDDMLKGLDTGGGKFGDFVRREIEEKLKLQEEEISTAANWWAQSDSPNYCGFDLELKLNLPKPEARLLMCLARNILTHKELNANLMIGIFLSCDIMHLVDIDAILRKLRDKYKEELEERLRELDRRLNELDELADRHPVLKKVVEDTKKLVRDLIRNGIPNI